MWQKVVVKNSNGEYIKKYEQMQDAKNQSILTLLDEELQQLFDSVTEIPYSALPLEPPQIIFITGRVKTFGYSADEILADRQLWINMIHPADREQVLAAFTDCKDKGTAFEIEYRIIHKDGSVRYVIDEGYPVLNDKGQIMKIEGIITDISELRRVGVCRQQSITKER